jgi:TonB family protein
LEYPRLASQALIQGIVVVRAKLDNKGNVVDATALSGAETLTPACLENIKKWRFRPNRKKEVVVVYSFWVDGTVLKPGCNRFVVEPPNFAMITTCAHEIQ